ncbi:MAG: TlpA disulfide reductase family protein [Perlabentimonas sp.]
MIINAYFKSLLKLFPFIFFFVATACGDTSNSVIIEGRIENSANDLLLLRETSDDRIATLDSTRTSDDGSFIVSANISNPKFLLLQLEGESEPIVLLAKPKEEIIVNGRKGNFSRNYTLSGSKGSILVKNLNDRLNKVVYTIDSLSYLFRNNREHPKFDSIKTAVDTAYFKAIRAHKDYTINFIKENRYSLASVLALYQQYDRKSHVLSSREDFEYFRMVDAALYPLYPENPLVSNLHSNVKKIASQLELYDKRQDMFLEGEELPNVMLTTIDGDTIDLLDVQGRYKLVDFWATWCNECIPNNTKLKQIYSKFKPKGFEVIQICVDDNEQTLNDYVEQNETPWIMVADYLQWESPVLDSMSINSIPSNYLIDRNGVIKARNLSHKELTLVLDNLLP